MEILGIDVGGTGTKGAIVDTVTGTLVSERIKYATPKPATPDSVIAVICKIVEDLNWQGKPIGMGFPAVILNDSVKTAVNIDKSWVDVPLKKRLNDLLDCHISLLNDADAAGLAESAFGETDQDGVLLFITLGTGLGSALIYNGTLVPNLEAGSMKWKDADTEAYASNRIREDQDLSWKKWGKNLNGVLHHLVRIFSPDNIVLGGGVSKKFEKYRKYIDVEVPVEASKLLNHAGIIGAAYAAHQELN